jgi:Tol biopolymer transport system component
MLRFGMLLSAVIGILLVSLPAARASRSESRAGVQALGLKGHYLGQKPPGKTPELFAPDVFRDVQFHDSPSFSRDGTELFASVTGNNEQFRYFRSTGVTWSREAAPFDVPTYLNGLFLSPSGRRLYLLVFENGRENFYHLDKTDGRWSKRQSLGSEVNSLAPHWSFSVANSEHLYFTSEGDVYVSRFDGQKHTRPVKLPAPVNTSAVEMCAFIAPDESYLLFARDEQTASGPSGRIKKDLLISFRLKGDAWSQAMPLGSGVNVPGVDDISPMVSPDGKYLFFVRAWRAFWVDAGVIEDLRRSNGVVR